MAVRLFVGNLSYGTTEADLRAYFGAIAPPSQIVLPVDRETGRPLSADEAAARRYLEAGALFVAVGVDTTLLARSAERLAAQFKRNGDDAVKQGDGTY